jgi:hypothetical protein
MIKNYGLSIIAALLICLTILSPSTQGGELKPIQLPPPPYNLLQPLDREVVLEPIAGKSFTWSPVEKAALYHLEISTDQTFRVLILDSYPTNHSFRIKKLPEGTFYWHISSINATGLEGSFSTTSIFFYPRRAK